MKYFIKIFLLLWLVSCSDNKRTGVNDDLLEDFFSNPYEHPDIPVVVFSGNIPKQQTAEIKKLYVADFGGIPDDEKDDTESFRALLLYADKWTSQNEGVVEIILPKGEFILSDVLHLSGSRIRLIGSGSVSTTLLFTKSLQEAFSFRDQNSTREFSWRGAMIWVQPSLYADHNSIQKKWTIASTVKAGSNTVNLREGSAGLKKGDYILLNWRGPASLLQEMYGAKEFDYKNYEDWKVFGRDDGLVAYNNLFRIDAVSGKIVSLNKGVRLSIKDQYNCYIIKPERMLAHDVVISGISIKFHGGARKYTHLAEKGYNALFLEKVANSNVYDVAIINADNGIIFENSHHNEIRNVKMDGLSKGHHAVSIRHSHDNMIDGWQQISKIQHGLGVQDMSSGNVFRNCIMNEGTLDCHRGMPFDNVWTQIKFINLSGGSGGAYGPMSGKNHVIWGVDFENVNNDMKERYSSKRIRKSISAFLNPDSFHSGVKVGLKGASRLVEHLKDERYIEIIQNLDQSEHVGDLYEIQKDNF